MHNLERDGPANSFLSCIYEAGEPLPAGLVSFEPAVHGQQWRGEAVFDTKCEVSFRDGWCRMHLMEPGSPNNPRSAFSITGENFHARIACDIRVFDIDGSQKIEIKAL